MVIPSVLGTVGLASPQTLLAYARRDGVADEDMLHAVVNSMAAEDLGDDPDRWLVVGPDRSANLLEVIVLLTKEGTEMLIHAMPLRGRYRRLLKR